MAAKAEVIGSGIAADTARLGQVGPKVGSVDPGFGTMYLARILGEKKAREFWYLCEQYTAEECRAMGRLNKVVPAAELMDTARARGRKIATMSPSAITLAKASFNVPSEEIRGIGSVALRAVALYYGTEEALEGKTAFVEKRAPSSRSSAAERGRVRIRKAWTPTGEPCRLCPNCAHTQPI